MKNTPLAYTPGNPNSAMRGSTARVCETLANGGNSGKFTRSDAVSNARFERALEDRAAFVADYRRKMAGKTTRTANITRKENGTHVVGFGLLPFSFRETRFFLFRRGYTHFRQGAAQRAFAV